MSQAKRWGGRVGGHCKRKVSLHKVCQERKMVRDKDWYLLLGHVATSPDLPTHQGHLTLGHTRHAAHPQPALEAQEARGCHTLTSVSSEFVCDSFFWGSMFTTLSTFVVPTRMASRWATVLVSGNKIKL